MKVFRNKTTLTILDKYQDIWALEHLNKLASWDLETYMPEAGSKARGLALAKSASLVQKLFLDPDFNSLIKKLQQQSVLNDYERAVARVLAKQLDQFEKLPKQFIENWQNTINQAQVVWRQARKEDNFDLFSPFLEKIIQLSIEKADLLGYKDNPYDALLDEFEEGSTARDLETHFTNLKPFLQDLLSYIKHSAKFSEQSNLKKAYSQEKLIKLNQKVLQFLRQDKRRLRLDISAHPFTQSISREDVRITTAYRENDFGFTLGASIHEFGHALYELQIHPDLEFSPIGEGLSLGIHESQSRFWENFIGKSSQFIHHFKQDFDQLGFGEYSFAEYFSYLNQVNPGLIRIEADELTYHFHILIRYEIEKALINKEIKVADVAEIWNQKYQDYLGVKPRNNSDGVLQDIHWSMGAIGYFPTYSTGSVLSAQWRYFLQKELGDIDSLIANPQGVEKIQNWLKDNIHQYGATYSLKDLVKKVTGEDFSTKYWQDYMFEKYHKIY